MRSAMRASSPRQRAGVADRRRRGGAAATSPRASVRSFPRSRSSTSSSTTRREEGAAHRLTAAREGAEARRAVEALEQRVLRGARARRPGTGRTRSARGRRAGSHARARKRSIVAMDMRCRTPAQDQVGGARLERERVRVPLEPHAGVELREARRPAEDLEQLLAPPGDASATARSSSSSICIATRIWPIMPSPRFTRSSDSCSTSGVIFPLATRSSPSVSFIRFERHRDRDAVRELDLLLLLAAVVEREHAAGAEAVEVMEQRREGQLVERARHLDCRSRRRGRRAGPALPRVRRDQREQLIERDRLLQHRGGGELPRARLVVGRERAARHQQHGRLPAGAVRAQPSRARAKPSRRGSITSSVTSAGASSRMLASAVSPSCAISTR